MTTSFANALSWSDLDLELDHTNKLKTTPPNTLTEKQDNEKGQKVYELVYKPKNGRNKDKPETVTVTRLGGGTFKEVYAIENKQKDSLVANFFKSKDGANIADKSVEIIQKIRKGLKCDARCYSDSLSDSKGSDVSDVSNVSDVSDVSDGSCCSHISAASVAPASPKVMLTQPLATDLFQYIQKLKNLKKTFPDIALEGILNVCQQIIECLACFHPPPLSGVDRAGYFHGDIKPENFVVREHPNDTARNPPKARVLLIDLDDVAKYEVIRGELTPALSPLLPFTFGYCSWRPDPYSHNKPSDYKPIDPWEEDAYAIYMTIADVLFGFFSDEGYERVPTHWSSVDKEYMLEEGARTLQKFEVKYRIKDSLQTYLTEIYTHLSKEHLNTLGENIKALFSLDVRPTVMNVVLEYPLLEPTRPEKPSIYESLCGVLEQP